MHVEEYLVAALCPSQGEEDEVSTIDRKRDETFGNSIPIETEHRVTFSLPWMPSWQAPMRSCNAMFFAATILFNMLHLFKSNPIICSQKPGRSLKSRWDQITALIYDATATVM